MSADRIELFDYIDQLRCSVPDVHPAGRMMIHHWLGEMREAAARDDAATVVKLAQMSQRRSSTTNTIADEANDE